MGYQPLIQITHLYSDVEELASTFHVDAPREHNPTKSGYDKKRKRSYRSRERVRREEVEELNFDC